jgi:hypothetical protein
MIPDARACSTPSRSTSPTRQTHRTPEPWALMRPHCSNEPRSASSRLRQQLRRRQARSGPRNHREELLHAAVRRRGVATESHIPGTELSQASKTANYTVALIHRWPGPPQRRNYHVSYWNSCPTPTGRARPTISTPPVRRFAPGGMRWGVLDASRPLISASDQALGTARWEEFPHSQRGPRRFWPLILLRSGPTDVADWVQAQPTAARLRAYTP